MNNDTEYTKDTLLKKFYNRSIQIDKAVINDIIDTVLDAQRTGTNVKMLVFGLGYDSQLWYNLTQTNTYFVENTQSYIDLNKDISSDHIIYYKYNGICVKDSMDMSDETVKSFTIPPELLHVAPFDVIIIDGPQGYQENHPGRLLPIYWSKRLLSKRGTFIYVDDSNRSLERHCINRFLSEHQIKHFPQRDGCDKFVI